MRALVIGLELALWADSSGLTLAEAARVQPAYRENGIGGGERLFGLGTGAISGAAVVSSGNVAKANVIIGVASAALSVRGFRHKDTGTASARRQASEPTRQRSVAINPIVTPGGRRGAIGIGVGATF